MKLKKGNVIRLEKGMRVYAPIPIKFIYSNRRISNELNREAVEVGKVYNNHKNFEETIEDSINSMVEDIQELFLDNDIKIEESKIANFVKSNIPEQKKDQFILEEGEFLVTKTTVDGGGTGHGIFDIYPDGYHVFCKALKNGKYDPNGVEIDFYQSGSFSCVITDLEPIPLYERKLKLDKINES